MVLNPSGTMLAAVGDSSICLFTLPQTIDNNLVNQSHIYGIEGLEGSKIKKVLWHPAMPLDAGLVILTEDSRIILYNVTTSTEVPQLSIDLKKFLNFKSQASSISFGSADNLAGYLTLYVASTNGDIFAIYPFLAEKGKVRCTHQQVEQLHENASKILGTINNKFPSTSIMEVATDTGLKARAIKHYQYISHMKKAADKVMKLEDSNPGFTPIIEVNQKGDDVSLQGPLNIAGAENIPEAERKPSIIDLIEISSNDDTIFLSALCSNSSGETFVRYFIQDSPLMMSWKSDEEDEEELVQAEEEKAKASLENKNKLGYAKPKRGFGFVAIPESSGTRNHDSKEENALTKFDKKLNEKKFVEESLLSLKIAGHDNIGNFTKELKGCFRKLSNDASKIAIISGDKVLFIDTQAWSDKILEAQSSDIDFIQYDKFNSKHPNPKVLLLTDNTTNTGDFLVLFYNYRISIEIRKLGKEEKKKEEEKKEEEKKEEEKKEEEKKEIKNPQLHMQKVIYPSNISLVILTKKLNSEDTQVLQSMNDASRFFLQLVQVFSKAIFGVTSRLELQTSDLRQQIETLNEDNKKIEKQEYYETNEKRIEELKKKQKTINEKQEALKKKLIDSIHRLRNKSSSPLSKEERFWFKEINSLNIKINKDNSEDLSLMDKVKSLNGQLESVKAQQSGETKLETEDDELSRRLQRLRLSQDLTKLKTWLQEEGKLIDVARHKLDDHISKIKV
ncbi:hypothetical protein HYPBUDRAFT_123526 [Hyphopichia burtonii NRRL Y-1933]|uniref:Uncharacterized protein n=1 Tax=Hyphopichia burtonii NRRL Y-1933 TaxID=984485 RepID=A0A1E4RLP2_9ASCO|nr:hypothetical protein HYPBUDRAFT_123526 [Hyphopichia burtonii NRRL Y-1933]ODV68156.1 hypothetical protein HYPBUDRAFT_123526 [Hyphopichia burtonii NRRL Y-1933]